MWEFIRVLTISVILGAFLITLPLVSFFNVDFTWFVGLLSTLGGFLIFLLGIGIVAWNQTRKK